MIFFCCHKVSTKISWVTRRVSKYSLCIYWKVPKISRLLCRQFRFNCSFSLLFSDCPQVERMSIPIPSPLCLTVLIRITAFASALYLAPGFVTTSTCRISVELNRSSSERSRISLPLMQIIGVPLPNTVNFPSFSCMPGMCFSTSFPVPDLLKRLFSMRVTRLPSFI